MKIAVLTNSVSSKGAGIAYYISELYRAFKSTIKYEILALEDGANELTLTDDLSVKFFRKEIFNGFKFGYSRMLKKYLFNECNPDVLHINSVWGFTHWLGFKFAKKRKIARINSIHGMLDPQALAISSFKKNLFSYWFVKRSLQQADCIHATTQLEYHNIRKYGITSPVAIVPIGLDLGLYKEVLPDELLFNKWPELKGKKIILYLSRINPKKAVENLAEVWGKLNQRNVNWHLVIAGEGESSYVDGIKSILRKHNALKDTTFTGNVYKAEKNSLFNLCEFFVLPTKTENFGIVIPEAFAFKKPVITTIGAPWEEIQEYQCGWWIPHGTEPLEKAMHEAIMLSKKERMEMGQRGFDLIKSHYSWDIITEKMNELFTWLLEKKDKPKFVYNN